MDQIRLAWLLMLPGPANAPSSSVPILYGARLKQVRPSLDGKPLTDAARGLRACRAEYGGKWTSMFLLGPLA